MNKLTKLLIGLIAAISFFKISHSTASTPKGSKNAAIEIAHKEAKLLGLDITSAELSTSLHDDHKNSKTTKGSFLERLRFQKTH